MRPPYNLLQLPPILADEEIIEILESHNNLRIERIISNGQVSPEGFWYEQEESEWLCLLQGEAKLLVNEHQITLITGDSLFLPAKQRHRVIYTSSEPPCIWLCVFSSSTN